MEVISVILMFEVIALYNEVPEGATMVKKDIDAKAFERWTLRAKEKWNQ
jgi:hypothetical protein